MTIPNAVSRRLLPKKPSFFPHRLTPPPLQTQKNPRSIKMKRKSSNSTEALERLAKKNKAASSDPKSEGLDAISRSRGRKKPPTLTNPNLTAFEDEQEIEAFEGDFEEEEAEKAEGENASNEIMAKRRKGVAVSKRKKNNDQDFGFVGKPVPQNEAMKRWPHRYKSARNQSPIPNKDVDDGTVKAKCHYLQAKVDGCTYNLYDNAYVKAGEGEADYIGRITEFFESTDKELYFTAQWFFRAEDTVIKTQNVSLDDRRVFLSDETDNNVLDCIVSKVHIARTMPNDCIPPCDLYYDMSYSPKFSTFANLSLEEKIGNDSSSSEIEDCDTNHSKNRPEFESEVTLLDLYSGCGAMSTGLCLGAQLSGLNLQTRWAVDLNPHACESLKLNHPKTEVRNEKAEDFLSLLHEWDQLCQRFGVLEESAPVEHGRNPDQDENSDDLPTDPEVFEVERIIGICYGETENLEKVGLKFKVQWKGYGPEEDTWEPAEGLSDCPERIREFVQFGYQNNILPLPGRVDVICGGPPCQGVSGFNRFRNVEAPLEDPKNYQLKVYMDIVDFLKPKYVLMENVVDILKFAGGYLGRYALSRLVAMNYQARLGIVAAGSFGLPQFRFRAFLWGACLTKSLPQFPLPTHNVVARGLCPVEFELNVVPFKETQGRQIEKALLLEDAISDLPAVTNDEERDEMDYGNPPKTNFQSSIRRPREGGNWCENDKLFDHRPLKLKPDDYLRVCEIPKRKGANFRDLAGVLVGPDKVVYLDPNMERVKLPSGKPLVPDYALSFVKGKSLKPFGRLWWDEIIATVVTRAEPHNQALLHPVQDRVLTIREIARLQGFPDYYKLCGPVKERYIQVGNAVAVPAARALGYGLGMAYQGKGSEEATFELPPKFPDIEFSNEDSETVEN